MYYNSNFFLFLKSQIVFYLSYWLNALFFATRSQNNHREMESDSMIFQSRFCLVFITVEAKFIIQYISFMMIPLERSSCPCIKSVINVMKPEIRDTIIIRFHLLSFHCKRKTLMAKTLENSWTRWRWGTKSMPGMTAMIGRCEWWAGNSSSCPQYDIVKHASNDLTEVVRNSLLKNH